MNFIDAELERRNLTNVNKAPDLATLKTAVISKIAQNNIAWYEDYRDVDGSKTLRAIRGLETIISDEEFMKKNANNSTWRTVKAYLMLRNDLAAMLQQRNQGTIDNQANRDIRNMYDAIVAKLKKDDINFADMYDRFLSQDKVYDKYLAGVK